MSKAKTTTTIEYPIEEFKTLIQEKLFPGKDVQVKFVIKEVGADPLDRYRGHDEVTEVRITFDGPVV